MKLGRGFTLVELLLALGLMSMLLALAYGGLRASTRAADKGQAILEDSSRIRMAHQFVRKQLNQMIPIAYLEDPDTGERVVFEGSSKIIRFVAPMPGYLGFGGPQVQELAVVPGDEGEMLVLSHALLQGFEEQNLYFRDPIVLLEKVGNAEFSFLGRDETGELTGWTNQWDLPDVLPESVSLDVEFADEVYIQWPLLTASVRVDPAALQGLESNMGIREDYSTTIRDMINKRRQQN
ncbi:MAG: prepilin-type N-terminal cleavage/methylation domain-containing protein [Xanthomonadales bacterium]|nr:prepilin-type N-terminal cleavage/methylation domain-containing protein [Gammaproteobacteria bacterium]MBT8052624.1 prepilin-type N-terminal cleavage/methylation domain-containing protein [Gammaproteobacteria bacterium]NND56617.1 prepilin-type N-terminal cleavage/methylation domain-containing protein [Xanthomonadales bacterium]NNK52441.1 prepilin-type N-terminal cleavage/methylation domain-containing protein [Xanthomonadales bacterium]